MAEQMIFVNLPVADLARARAFWTALGFGLDGRFSDDTAACVVVSPAIHVMLLAREKFAGFAPRPVGDPSRDTSVLLAFSRPSREAVDAFVEAALAAGGADNDLTQEHGGFMYGRSVSDPDGHVIEVMWIDVARAAPSFPGEMDAAVDA